MGSAKGVQLLDRLEAMPGNDPGLLMEMANRFLRLGDMAKSEAVVQRLVVAMPGSSEPLYNLALIQAHRGESALAIASLQKSLALNATEMTNNPKMINLRQHLFEDQNFAQLRQTPEFIAAFGTKP